MSFRFGKLFVLICTVIIIGIAFIIFAVKIVMSSLSVNFKDYQTDLVKGEADIYRNDFGIPHIITESEQDLYFMLGYAQAEDRLWQMDYYRRLAQGETAEIFGEKELKYDKFIRAFDLKGLSNKIYKNLGPDSRIILKSFSDGVNFFIKNNLKKLPVEFSSLSYTPTEWTPADCIAVFKLLCLKNSPGFVNDLIMGEMSNAFGEYKALSLIGEYPVDAPLIYEANMAKIISDTSLPDTSKTAKYFSNKFYENLTDILPKITSGTGSIGSNAWAVSEKRNSREKYAVLANDPHYELANPAQYYQAKLTCSNYNLTGLILCGTPIMLIGRNDNISWGYTNSMADDFDYYIEKTDEAKPDFYYNSDSTLSRFTFTVDTIKIKNKPIYTYYKRSTKLSGVISDYHLENKEIYRDKPKNNSKSNNYYNKYCLTYDWSGNSNYDDLEHFYNIIRCKNWESFLNTTRKINSPVFNYIFSDKSGNIAMATTGLIPVRNQGINSTLPLIRNNYNKWNGYISPSEMPYVINPDKSYIAAANNKLFSNRFAGFSKYWDSPSRAERLDTLLKNTFRYSYRDAQIMQNDIYSPLAERIVKIIIPILTSNYSNLDLAQKEGLERLKKWDFRMMPTFPSSMIFNEFYKNLIKNIFLDDLGETYFRKYLITRSFVNNKILNILANPKDPFIKNYRNSAIYDLNSLFLITYKQSIDSLTSKFNSSNSGDWIYGNEHYVKIQHKFAENKFLKPSFEMEQFFVGGNGSTINNLEFDYNSPYKVIIGAVCKFITDMSKPYVYTSVPGGTSGQNYSENYSDQLQLWIFGGYVKLNTGRKPDTNFKLMTRITR